MTPSTPGWGWWPPQFSPCVEKAANATITVSLAASAIRQLAVSPEPLVFFIFAAVRTTVVVKLIYQASPWFLYHRSHVFAVTQVLTSLLYFIYVLKIPWMMFADGAAHVPNRLPASGTLDRVRFLLLLPMLQLNMGLSCINSVRGKQLSLLVTLGLGLLAAVVRCKEEATNSPASGEEYAQMVGAAEAMLAPWIPAASGPQKELSGAAACVAVNTGVQFGFGVAITMAVMLIEETISRHSFIIHSWASQICLRPPNPILAIFYAVSDLFQTILCFSAVVTALRLLQMF